MSLGSQGRRDAHDSDASKFCMERDLECYKISTSGRRNISFNTTLFRLGVFFCGSSHRIYFLLSDVNLPWKQRLLRFFILPWAYMFINLREREREKYQLVASPTHPNRRSNPQPFGAWDDAPTNWATQPGQLLRVFIRTINRQIAFHSLKMGPSDLLSVCQPRLLLGFGKNVQEASWLHTQL